MIELLFMLTAIARSNVQIAYDQLESLSYGCISTAEPRDICDLTPREHELFQAILGNLNAERRTVAQLEFHSELAEPGFFMLDGAVRVAKTLNQVGAPIYLNEDFLVAYDRSGLELEPLSIPHATAILFHELGHHVTGLGEPSHEELDLLGAKVRRLLEDHSSSAQILDAGPGPYTARALSLMSAVKYPRARLILSDETGSFDVTDQLLAHTQCNGDPFRGVPFNPPNLIQPLTMYWSGPRLMLLVDVVCRQSDPVGGIQILAMGKWIEARIPTRTSASGNLVFERQGITGYMYPQGH